MPGYTEPIRIILEGEIETEIDGTASSRKKNLLDNVEALCLQYGMNFHVEIPNQEEVENGKE